MQKEKHSLEDKALGLGVSVAIVGLLATGCSFGSGQADVAPDVGDEHIELVGGDTFKGDGDAAVRVKGIRSTFGVFYSTESEGGTGSYYPGSEPIVKRQKEVEAAKDVYFDGSGGTKFNFTDPGIKRLVGDIVASHDDYSEGMADLRRKAYEELISMGNENELAIEQVLRDDAREKAGSEYIEDIEYMPTELDWNAEFNPNLSLPIDIGYPEEGGEDEFYDRTDFAEVVIGDDGNISLSYSDTLDKKSIEQLKAVYRNVGPFVEAAIREGSLIRVRFVLGDGTYAAGGGGVYSGVDREIIITVPEHGETALSLDDLEGTLMHETLHALTRRGNMGQGVSESEFNDFVGVCNTLALSAFNSAVYSGVFNDESKMDILKGYLPEDQKYVVDDFIAHVKDGRIGSVLFGDEEYSEGPLLLYACRNSSDITDLIESFAERKNVTGFSFDDDVDLDEDITVLNDSWSDSVRGGSSVYSLLNEAKYVVSDDGGKKYFGHSEDNAAELIASFLHVGLRYQEELKMGVSSLNYRQKQALRDLTRLSVDMVIEDNPELTGVMSDFEAEMLSTLS